MTQPPSENPTELFLRFSRRNMFVLLFIVLFLGGTGVALTVSPRGAVSQSAFRGLWLVPVVIAFGVGVQTSMLRRRWDPNSVEVKTIMEDEWRRTNMARGFRAALIVTLASQFPLAWTFLYLELAPPRLAQGMAISTITIGLATLIAVFLYFDRE